MERVKEAGTPNLVGQAMAREHASSMQQAVTYSYEEDPFAATTIERSSGPRPADREELFPLCGKKLPKSSGIGAGYCPQRLIIASRARYHKTILKDGFRDRILNVGRRAYTAFSYVHNGNNGAN